MNTVFFSSELAPPISAGDVTIPGPLFEVGEYPEKNFSLTEAEADAAIAAFTPVPMNSEHHDDATFHGAALKGAWGQIEKIWRDGKQIMAQYNVPGWLAGAVRDKGIKLKTSAEWDRNTKQLVAAAWTLKPYLTGNDVIAAFSAVDLNGHPVPPPSTEQEIKVPAHDHGMITKAGWTRVGDTKNMKARYEKGQHRAIYDPSQQEDAGPGEEQGKPWSYFHEKKGIIHQHPHLVSLLENHDNVNPAKFAEDDVEQEYKEHLSKKTAPEFWRPAQHHQLLKEGWHYHQPYGDHEYIKLPKEITGFKGNKQPMEKMPEGQYPGGHYFSNFPTIRLKQDALKHDGHDGGAGWSHSADKKPYKNGGGHYLSHPSASLGFDEAKKNAMAHGDNPMGHSWAHFSEDATPELLELNQLRAEKLRRIAEDFANDMVRQERAVPGERGPMIAMFMALHADDRDHGDAVVRFNEASQPVSRIAAFKSMFEARPPHGLSAELLDPRTQPAKLREIIASFSTIVNPDKTEGMDGKDSDTVTEARRKELLAATPMGREVLQQESKLG